MTMFYEPRDLRLIDETRVRRLINEELDARREPSAPAGFLRTIDGDFVSIDQAMGQRMEQSDV